MWLQPYYVGNSHGIGIRCYEYEGDVYQLTIDWNSYRPFLDEGKMPIITQDYDNSICLAARGCHGEEG